MHPEDIKAALKKAGASMAHLARDLGVSRASVGVVVDGFSRSKRTEDAIAHVLGLDAGQIWPQWYGGLPVQGVERDRLPPIDAELVSAIQACYLDAVRETGALGVPLEARHLIRIYNRCAEQLSRSDTAQAKQAVASKEIRYLADSDALPRFDPRAAAPAQPITVHGGSNRFAGHTYNEGLKK